MGKYPIYAILSGMLLALASCVPVVGSLYRMAAAVAPERFELPIDGRTRLDQGVERADTVRLVLVFELPPGWTELPGISYRADLRNGEQIQQHLAGSIEPHENVRVPDNSGKGGPVWAEEKLPVLELADGQSAVGLDIEIDAPGYQPGMLKAWGEFHRDPPRFALSFVNAAVVWVLGTLLVLIGAIQWGRQIAVDPPGRIPPTVNDKQERIWCMLCHLSALLGYIVPFAHVLAPLLIWSTKRGNVRGVDDAGRESLNFQLTVSLFALIGIMLSALFVGLVLLFVLVVFHVSMTLFASLRAQRGDPVRYPMNLRIIGTAEKDTTK